VSETPTGASERLAFVLLAATAPPHLRLEMEGDLLEELAREPAGSPDRRAKRLWLWRQVLGSVVPNLMTRARRHFSNRRAPHRRRGGSAMNELIRDLRYALRAFARQPVSTAVVVATVALGIAATTVVLSLVHGVLFDPFPFPRPDRLVGVGPEYPKLGRPLEFWEVLSPAEIGDVRDQSRTLERVVAWDMGNRQMTGGDEPENVFSAFWWGDPLATLEVSATVGRSFTAEETARGEKLAMISHRLWQRMFGGDPAVVGKAVEVNGDPHTLVGVMPPGTLVFGTDLWLPMPVGPEVFPRARRQFQLLARVREGHDLADVNAELETIARRVESSYAAEHEEYAGWRLEARTWNAINLRSFRPMAAVLLGAIAFVLLLVCANVASLLIGRGAQRRRELAVRQALGAGRPRVLRQLLTESVLLAGVSGLCGVGLAVLGVRALAAAVAGLGLPLPFDVEVNGKVLALAAGATVACGLLFGMAPALQAVRSRVEPALRGAARGSGKGALGAPRQRLQRVLVGVEAALALVLLFGAGLLVRSLIELQSVDPGIDHEGVLTLRITLPWERYDEDGIADFFARLTDTLEARPDVETAALASQLPPNVFASRKFEIEGAPPLADGALPDAFFTAVSPDFFQALDARLLRGRAFEPTDDGDAPRVAVLNEAAARRFFPDADPLGKRLRVDPDDPWIEIVGLVADHHNRGLETPPAPEFYGSLEQLFAGNQLFVLLESELEPAILADAVRGEVRAIDPDQPVYAVQALREAYADQIAPRRLVTTALAMLGAFALLLAGVGVYGVVSSGVAQRRPEIGLRLALGAAHGQLRRLLLRDSLWPVAVGGVVGLAGAAALAKVMGGLLFEVKGLDPTTLAGALAVLLAVAALATWIPAWRASQVDPVETLREE
jgi:predicted permease